MNRDPIAQLERDRLHRAAQAGDLARVDDLIERKFSIDCFDDIGKTPLHYAVQDNRLEVVKRLIEAGANVNAHDERWIGNTPLSDNVRECTYEMVKVLIDAGADPTIRGWMQLNAINRALERKDANARKIVRLLEGAACITKHCNGPAGRSGSCDSKPAKRPAGR
ncbi:MAG: ankyrin repeat domain-containing protein [Verrucomicrobiota bacterium]